MKNIFTTAALSAAILIASCASASSAENSATDQPTKEAKAANPGKMNELMTMLDGTEGCGQKAADAFFSDSLKNSLNESNNLTFANYNMSEAKMVAVAGQCCTMEAKAGVTARSFKLCWEGDKVTGVEDLGMK